MSHLREKALVNLEVAEYLVKESKYAPSVHCSYFGCLQFLKYTLRKFRDETYEDIEKQCNIYLGGTHGYIIDSCLAEYRKKVDFAKHKEIKRELKDLKEFRVSSDYFNVEVGDVEGEKSLKYSQKIIREIGKVLKK